MVRTMIVGVCMCMCLPPHLAAARSGAEEPSSVQTQAAAPKDEAAVDLAQLLVGSWTLAPNARATKGSLRFEANGSYELNETLHDGTGVGTKGRYQLDPSTTPASIDLCLGDCGQPGSEWTTRFGILRALSADELEIYSSLDGTRPTGFPEDKGGETSLMLTRVQPE